MKQKKAAQITAKNPLKELNSTKDGDDDSSNDDLPLNLEEKEQSKISSSKRKRQMEKVKSITSKINSFNIEKQLQEDSRVKEMSLKQRRKEKKKLKRELQELSDNDVVDVKNKKKKKLSILDDDDEDMKTSVSVQKEPKPVKKIGYKLDSFHISPSKVATKKVRITTPIRNKKKSKKNIEALPKLAEDYEHSKQEGELNDESSVSKRVNLDEEAFCDDGDDIDKINSVHHQNVPFKHKAVQVEINNFESSSRKDKKKSKKNKKDIGFNTKEWELKQNKKHENLEKKKQKRLKNMHRRDEKLSAKKLKKLAKQQLLATKMEIS